MLSTTILVTTSNSRVAEIHQLVLTVLADAFSKGIFSEFVSDVILSSYLGPDAKTFSLAEVPSDDDTIQIISVVVGVLFTVVVVLCAVLWVYMASKGYDSIPIHPIAGKDEPNNNLAIYKDADSQDSHWQWHSR